jgi:NAD(P) transhydrogenase
MNPAVSELAVELLVIGAGPAGHKAAIQAAKLGKRVLLVDRDPAAGGECVQRGTIPSKTLRESACHLLGLRARSEGVIDVSVPPQTKVASLMRRLKGVRASHGSYLDAQLARNGIERLRGQARFLTSTLIEIRSVDRSVRRVRAERTVIATGSRPRQPEYVPIDHEHVLDSDSILSLIYLPKSLVVLGGGVIACEFASLFAALGTEVTVIDAAARPLAFLDPELSAGFVAGFERLGGTLVSGRKVEGVARDGTAVVTRLQGGGEHASEKLLCAQGRVANVAGLDLAAAGLALTPRGHLPVDAQLRTAVPHIYGAGDVIGPPALAATSADQGRRAARHAFGLDAGEASAVVPVGIYTIPELACVGLSEAEAVQRFGSALVGRARFDELARAHINGETEGLLKLVADPQGKLVGAHVVGESAAELVHVAQMAMVGGLSLEALIDNVFNFPTMAEAYRVAALDSAARRAQLRQAG